VVFPTGAEIRMPPPSHNDLDREGWQVVEEQGPSMLLNDSVLVTGQIDRVTDFEHGFIGGLHLGGLLSRSSPRRSRPWSSSPLTVWCPATAQAGEPG
jgi:hypothetical protein